MIYPANIEQKIDFPVIREQLHKACSSALGRREVDKMEFLTDYQAILHRLREAEEMVKVLSDASLNFPRGEINDLRESLTRVRIEGLYLDEAELFQLRKSVDYAAQLERFFLGLDAMRFPQLRTFPTRHLRNLSGETTASVLQPVITTVDKAIDPFGQLRDSASPELNRIRRELSQAQGAVSASIASILRRAQAAGLVDKDATPTLREGRLVLPIPAGAKKKIGGIVHDESATGKTVFIEPQEVVEANNRIRSLESEQARERLRILHEITTFVRPLIPQILLTQDFLAHVDFIIAKALVAKRLKAIAPHFVDYPMVDIREARHAVLYLRFMEEGKTVVPLTMRLEKEGNRILVISGPNAGGKSVCLKTVALCQYMLQCGLPVPVSEASTMGLFDKLMIDIGDEQSIEDDLSTYSSHLRNMKAFVRFADSKTLFLIDEFGTGTEPLIGGAIAESVLTSLNEQQAMPDKEMAEALDMSYISYRVTLHHMRNNVRCFREKLLRGESLRLDDKQTDLAKHIYDDFPNLYPILFDCYIQCIDTLKTSAAVKELRSQYMEERGFVVHEPSISEQTHITITRFWEILNQWLRVD